MAEQRRAAPWKYELPGLTDATMRPIQVIAFVLVLAAIWGAKVLLVPLAVAALASCGLDPVHRRLVRLGMPPGLAAAAVVTTLALALAATAWSLQTPATNFVNRLPELTEELREILRDGRGRMQPVEEAAEDINEAADETSPRPPRGVTRVQIEEPTTRVSDLIWMGAIGVTQFVVQATIVLFLVYYMLASRHRYREKLLTLAGPSLLRQHLTMDIVHGITEQIERFLVARVVITLIVSGASIVSFVAFGLNQAIIWGLLTGLANNVPYAGPAIAVAAVSLAALVQFDTLEIVILIGMVTMIISVIEGFVLTPWLMGRAGRMNSGAVFVSLMFWGWIWGVWGLLLAVPIMMTIKAVTDHVEAFRPASELLSE